MSRVIESSLYSPTIACRPLNIFANFKLNDIWEYGVVINTLVKRDTNWEPQNYNRYQSIYIKNKIKISWFYTYLIVNRDIFISLLSWSYVNWNNNSNNSNWDFLFLSCLLMPYLKLKFFNYFIFLLKVVWYWFLFKYLIQLSHSLYSGMI